MLPKKGRKIGKTSVLASVPVLFGLDCHSQSMSSSCQVHVHGCVTSHQVYQFPLPQSDLILTQFVDFQLGATFVLSDVDQVFHVISDLIPGLGEPLLILRQANACQPNMDVGLRRKTFPRLMSRKYEMKQLFLATSFFRSRCFLTNDDIDVLLHFFFRCFPLASRSAIYSLIHLIKNVLSNKIHACIA